MREAAQHLVDNLWAKDSTIVAMLRQAADAEEELANRKHAYAELMKVSAATNKENAQLKARLEAVVKECERGKWGGTSLHDEIINDILRAARGEGGAE